MPGDHQRDHEHRDHPAERLRRREGAPDRGVIGPQLAAFLATVIPVVVGTVRKDGTPQLNPAWYEYRDGLIWLNPAESRAWGRRCKPGARITLLFVDPTDMFHWAQVQGTVVERTSKGAEEHIDRLAQRYLGTDYRQHDPNDPRTVVTVRPTRVTGFRDRE